MDALKSVFRLTKRVYLGNKQIDGTKTVEDYSSIIKETLHYGFIISPEVLKKLNQDEIRKMVDGLKPFFVSETSWNNAFFQNWEKIKKLDAFEFFFSQMLHYVSVFFNDLELIGEEYIYLPERDFLLDQEEITMRQENLTLNRVFVVNEISKEDILKKIQDVTSTGFALSEDMVANIFEVVKDLDLDVEEVLKHSKNREFSCRLLADLNVVPKNPEDFVRQVVYACTDSTLVIKNKQTLETIKENFYKAEHLLYEYVAIYGVDELASVFLRYKPIFLMLKRNPKANSIVNRIRRRAKTLHKPLKQSPHDLSNVVERINDYTFNDLNFALRVKGQSPLKLVALYNHLLTINEPNRIYKIRNGKIWAERTDRSFSGSETKTRNVKSAMDALRMEIVRVVSSNLKGKKVYLPNNIDFAIPTSGKNFVGDLPEGTFVNLDKTKTTLFGVHWYNLRHSRVDLDLSCANNTGKIGWDADYSYTEREIWFSGDMTNASRPLGATEFFNIGSSEEEFFYSVYLNDYTLNTEDVEYTFILGQPREDIKNRKELIKLKDKLFSFKDTISKEKMLGLLENTRNSKRFYFGGGSTGTKRTVRYNDVKQIMHDASISKLRNKLSLNSVLLDCDVTLVGSKEDADISFDLDSLTPDLFLNLLKERV